MEKTIQEAKEDFKKQLIVNIHILWLLGITLCGSFTAGLVSLVVYHRPVGWFAIGCAAVGFFASVHMLSGTSKIIKNLQL